MRTMVMKNAREVEILLTRSQNGDRDAAYELWTKYGEQVASQVVRYRSLSPMDRQDLLSDSRESFVATAINGKLEAENLPSLKAFIRQLVGHRCIDELRKKSRRQTLSWEQDCNSGVDQESSLLQEASEPDSHLIMAEEEESKERALGALEKILNKNLKPHERDLTPKQYEVVELVIFEGKTMAKVARQLDVDRGTVEYRYKQALAQIRKSLRHSLYGQEDEEALKDWLNR